MTPSQAHPAYADLDQECANLPPNSPSPLRLLVHVLMISRNTPFLCFMQRIFLTCIFCERPNTQHHYSQVACASRNLDLSPQNAVHSVNHSRLPSLARAPRLADCGAGGSLNPTQSVRYPGPSDWLCTDRAVSSLRPLSSYSSIPLMRRWGSIHYSTQA